MESSFITNFRCENIEVMVPRLPEPLPRISEQPGALNLQHAQVIVQTFRIQLTEQMVHLFGHEDIAEEEKLVPLADSFDDDQEHCSRVIVREISRRQ